jgi:hypothetical protein
MEVTITVTAEDIKQASRNDPTACPIARAMQRLFGGRPVSVGTTVASVIYPDREDIYRLPPEARRFVTRFDAKRRVKPITFRAAYICYASPED